MQSDRIKMNLPFNWFDLLIVVVVIVGMQRGRKYGMSEELTRLLKWLAIAVGCAFFYEPLGTAIASNSVFSLLAGFLMAYLGVGLVIAALFALLKRAAGEKWVGKDVFGRSEFYLGMMAGMIRFCCMLIAALALLNARAYNSAEIRADIKYQNDLYGSDFFPKFYSLQTQVFESSLAGPWIKQNLSFLLIKPTAPDKDKKNFKQKESQLP